MADSKVKKIERITAWALVDVRRKSIPYGSSCPDNSRAHDAEGFMAICEERVGAETALREHGEFYKGCRVVRIEIRPAKKNKKSPNI